MIGTLLKLGTRPRQQSRAIKPWEGDGDHAPNDQVNVPTVQPSQEKESKAQELVQIIKNIMAAQSIQIPAQLPGFVSLISQA